MYKCLDRNNNERCIKSIKLIDTVKSVAEAHFEMIQHEIFLLQNLIHPRIITLYSYFYSNDGKYINIVMEYAKYGSLSTLIAGKADKKQQFDEKVRN